MMSVQATDCLYVWRSVEQDWVMYQDICQSRDHDIISIVYIPPEKKCKFNALDRDFQLFITYLKKGIDLMLLI